MLIRVSLSFTPPDITARKISTHCDKLAIHPDYPRRRINIIVGFVYNYRNSIFGRKYVFHTIRFVISASIGWYYYF